MRYLPELLNRAVDSAPEARIGFIQDFGPPRTETYGEFRETAARVSCGLRFAGVQAGDKVVVALGDNRDFLTAFWGCLLCDAIPIPLPSPLSSLKPGPILERIQQVIRILKGPFVLSEELGDIVPKEKALTFQELLQNSAGSPPIHVAGNGDTAFIQFSSGSTGQPKGVVLTHRNVTANLEAISRAVRIGPRDVTLNWMPLFHDMGLVGFHLLSVYSAISQFHIETQSFIKRPLLWLDNLDRTKATVTGSPNSGLDLVLTRLERQPEAKWDLSSLRILFNGAEPISVDLTNRFARTMSRFGFRPETMLTVYGMAEASVAITIPSPGEVGRTECLDRQELQTRGKARSAATEDASPVRLAVLGYPIGCELRIVDDLDQPVEDCRVGHIQVRGDSVTSGYFLDPGLNQESFCDSWLRTGDLGFLKDGQLCVTGRAKDVIFAGGQNYYANDLEDQACVVEGVRAGRIAICGWFDPRVQREKILLFLACRSMEAGGPVIVGIADRLQTIFGLRPDVMIPLKPGQFPKTTSGKLQRYKLREMFEQGQFEREIESSASWLALQKEQGRTQKSPPATVTEKMLHRIWCEELARPPEDTGIHDDLDRLGGKSIHAAAIIARIQSEAGVTIHSSVLAEHSTIAALAEFLDRNAGLRSGGRQSQQRYFRG